MILILINSDVCNEIQKGMHLHIRWAYILGGLYPE